MSITNHGNLLLFFLHLQNLLPLKLLLRLNRFLFSQIPLPQPSTPRLDLLLLLLPLLALIQTIRLLILFGGNGVVERRQRGNLGLRIAMS